MSMQSIEISGQLRAAAARRAREGKFWRTQLAGEWSRAAPLPDLPGDDPACVGRHTLVLPEALASRLADVARGNDAALEVLLLAATGIVLARYSGAPDLVLGFPAPGAARTGDSVLLPVRIETALERTFREFAAELRTRYLNGLEHHDFPFAVLAEEIGMPLDPQRHPLLDVGAAVDRAETVPAHGLRLMVRLAPNPGDWRLNLAYDTQRWTTDTVDRLGQRILSILSQGLERPGTMLVDLNLFSAADHQALARFNDTDCPYRDQLRLENVIQEACQIDPHGVALVGDGFSVTHAELDARSDAIALRLREIGVVCDCPVAVMVDRSPEMMAAIVGVLKAGGAWLPLDPSQPDMRLRHMLEDSQAPVLLARGVHLERSRALAPAGVCQSLDLDNIGVHAAGGQSVPSAGSPRDAAYAIYTSGSTGLPKAALVEHHSVVNRIDWMQKTYPIGPADVVLQKTTIAFDVSVWELFWWAFAGAKQCLLAPGVEKDPARLIDTIERHRVTTMHFVPSMLQAFLDYVEVTGCSARLASLRQVFASGEALGAHQIERFNRLLGGSARARLINLYGPTEATVDVSHFACDSQPALNVPIGYPIDNIRLHVVDARLQPLPLDLPGELCIAGVGLARGYLRRPELTRERFVEAAFPGEDRIYRTGDLARWRADGTVEYLGRIDHQVKIRGYRIELGEIEYCLRSLPAVKEAVALVRASASGDPVLMAWVQAEEGADEAGLRMRLAERLPEYMTPARIVLVDQFPLTPNGKLDRKALPEPKDEQAYEAPHEGVEALLAGIWSEVLGCKHIGRHDNFFALGGNSIHFVSVLARARRHGLVFAFETLFAYPTLEGLAPHVSREESSAGRAVNSKPFSLLSEDDLSRLPQGLEDAYPMTLLQAGLIYENEIAYGTAQYHDILTYVIHGAFDVERFTESVRRLVRRNAIFRTSYQLQGFDEYLQTVHTEDSLPLPLFIEDLCHLDDADQDAWLADWLQRERAHQFDWQNGGLVRLHVQVLRDDLFHYTLSQHNSALDGWSITLVHAQVFETYFSLLDGAVAPAAPKPHNHLRDYVALERASLASDKHRAFWSGLLAGGVATPLARWEPERPVQGLEVRFHEVEIPHSLSESLMRLADRLAVPLKSVLMAAHACFLATASGQSDIIAGYEHSGRPEVEEAEEAVGLFLNTLPLRVDVAQAASWRALIRLVYDAETALLPHRRYPMARMKSDLGVREPLFETAFNYTHFYRLKRLRDLPDFALLDVRASSETEFTLRAEFSRHFYTDEVRLSLHYHTNVFTAAQVEEFASTYRHVFEAMVRDVDGASDDAILAERRARSAALNVGRQAQEPWRAQTANGDAPAAVTELLKTLETPVTENERRVADIWAKVLGLDPAEIGRDDNFFDLGGNSLAAMRVVFQLKREVSLIEFMRNSNLRPLARLLDESVPGGMKAALLHTLKPAAVAVPRALLVGVPYAGGHTINFRPLADALASFGLDLEVAAVELPGHDPAAPESELCDVTEAATRIVAELKARPESTRIYLWGHCVGSATALEVARQLQQAGRAAAGVFIGGKLYPALEKIQQSIDDIMALDDAGIAAVLAADTGYTELAGADAELLTRMARLFRHDALASHRYLLDAPNTWEGQRLTAAITMVAADDDPYTPGVSEAFLNWKPFTTEVQLQHLDDGGHYFCRTRPQQVACIVATCIMSGEES